jgi:Protein of unknown function (DUF2459)
MGALLGGCAEMPAASGAPPPAFVPAQARHLPAEIGVLVAGWHTGLVLPAAELGPLRPLLPNEGPAKYLSFGWGDRRFYMAAHPGSGDALAALFRSPSALFVQPAAALADLRAGDADVHWVCAGRDALWRVDQFLEHSLSRPGKPIDLGPGPFPGSRFYASTGRYSAVHTCNTWTVAALEYAGLPVRASGVLFASQVRARVRELRACPAPQ